STAVDLFLAMPRSEFDALVGQRAKEKFTHLRVTIDSGADLREAAERVSAVNARGMTADMALASIPGDWQERERYLSEVVVRFAAFNITWMGLPGFEDVAHGRPVL